MSANKTDTASAPADPVQAWQEHLREKPEDYKYLVEKLNDQMAARAYSVLAAAAALSFLAGGGMRGLQYGLNRLRSSPVERAWRGLNQVDTDVAVPKTKTTKKKAADDVYRSWADVPGFVPGLIAALGVPLVGGYFLTDYLVKRFYERQEQSELERLRATYERELSQLHTQAKKRKTKKPGLPKTKAAQEGGGLVPEWVSGAWKHVQHFPEYYAAGATLAGLLALYWAATRAYKRTDAAALRRAVIARSQLRASASPSRLELRPRKEDKADADEDDA